MADFIRARLPRFMFVLGLLGLLSAAAYALLGDYRTALWVGLGGAASLLHSRVWGSPALSAVLLWAIAVLGLLALGSPAWWVIGVLGLVAIALVVLLEASFGVGVLRRWRTIEHEPARVDQAEPEAAFEDKGFRVVGAYRVRLDQALLDVTAMLGPDRDRVVCVSYDTAWLVSRFGDRLLVTHSYAESPVPPDVLRQEVYGWADELEDAHRAALALLAARGLQPDPFRVEADAVKAAQELDAKFFRFNSDHLLRSLLRMYVRTWRVEITQESAEPVLADDERTRRRINAWLRARTSPLGAT